MSRAQASAPLLARNAALNFGSEIGIVAVVVVTVPLVMRSLGESAFGLFSLAWVAINALSLFDVGVSRATTKYLAEHLARGEHQAGSDLVRTSAVLNLCLGLLGGGLVLATAPWMITHLLRVPAEMLGQARWTAVAVATAVPILLMQGTCRSVLAAFQRFDWNSSVRLATQATQWILAVVVARNGRGVAWVVATTVLTRLADVCVYSFLVRKLLPGAFTFSLPRGYAAKLLKFGGWVSVSLLIGPLLVYLDRVLLARFVSLAAVAIYTIPYEASTRLRILPASAVSTLYPSFSERSVGPDPAAVPRLYAGVIRYLSIVLLPCFGFLIVFGPEVMRVWMGAGFAAESGRVLQLIAIGGAVNALAYIPFVALQGLGRPDLPAKIHVLEVPFYCVVCLLLIPRFGVIGAAVAGILRFSVDTVALFWTADRYSSCSMQSLVNRKMAVVGLVGATLMLTLAGVRSLSPAAWLQLSLGLLVVAVYALFALRFLMDRHHRPVLARAVLGVRRAAAGASSEVASAGGTGR